MQSIRIQRPEDSALVHGTAAAFLQDEGRRSEAEAEYIAAIRAWGEAGRGETADTGDILNSPVALYIKEQRLDEARRTLDERSPFSAALGMPCRWTASNSSIFGAPCTRGSANGSNPNKTWPMHFQ
jgi:hypothetical protein